MRHSSYLKVTIRRAVVLLLLCGLAAAAHAQEVYTAPDENFGFKLPKRWVVKAEGDKIHLTSPDGNKFLVQQDVLKTLPSGPPAYDSGLKDEATRLAAKLLPKAEMVRGQTALVDHGAGAVFRFQDKTRGDDSPVIAVWVAIIGRHSMVIVPEKAAQSGEAIGLSTILQSATFADALPKTPPVRPGPKTTPGAGGAAASVAAMNGPHTVSYQTQIAPLLRQRCQPCHNSGNALGGLNVASFTEFMKGGDHGAAILAGKPDSSKLLDYLTGKRDRMPKGSAPLSDTQIGLFRTWIQEGATDESAAGAPGAAMEMNTSPTAPGGKRLRPGAGIGMLAGKKRPNQNPAAQESAGLMEGYNGHLVVSDQSFALNLFKDGTATADWTFSSTVNSHFTGTYKGDNGIYFVSLTLASGSNPYNAKTLVLDLRPRGNTEVGRFGLDSTDARRDVAELSLSRFNVNLSPGKAAGKGMKKRPGPKQ